MFRHRVPNLRAVEAEQKRGRGLFELATGPLRQNGPNGERRTARSAPIRRRLEKPLLDVGTDGRLVTEWQTCSTVFP